jgi:hypothetical protein
MVLTHGSLGRGLLGDVSGLDGGLNGLLSVHIEY